ncbi:MAG TPA: UDP-galactopyranose mutase [Candidatus Kapabacteria bacterium]|nr:UDP-galactopyranose mutase [Candidatus Kapabacteria bacterium]
MKYDYLIVGAGYAGSVLAERIATQLDKKCLIIDKRSHIAGNAFDYYDENGILVHKFGPHIFHTLSKKVWDYLSIFTKWNRHIHHVKAIVEGKAIPVPFNLNSIDQVFPKAYAEKLQNKLIENYGFGLKIPILKMLETKDSDLNFLANYIYKNVFHGYTLKQWGMKPEELDSSVSARVPVYISRDDRYFQDTYQGIPQNGYTAMFNNILNHKNIHILLNADFEDIKSGIQYDKLIYTGPIDTYFDYMYGELPYRSLKFDFQTFDFDNFQELAQINYPNNFDYTRITEFKHLTKQKHSKTTIAYEFPQQYDKLTNEPYYPIPKAENNELFQKYKIEVDKIADKVIFCGRLADYKYYNMDQIVGVALQIFEKRIAKLR